MKAIQVSETGGPEVLVMRDVPVPGPGPGQILVKVAVAGVNFIDTYHRRGLYEVPLPFTPGIEAAGTVEALGEGVDEFSVGQSVVFCLGMGAYAEMAVVDAWKTVPLPVEVDAESAVTAMCQGLTSHYLTTDCFSIRPGSRALVHAAAGGVGLLLVQMIKNRGGMVAGTVSTDEKAELARTAGVDLAINYADEDFEREISDWTEGKGVDVVYESVGKSTFSKSLNCLRPRGYLVLFGQASGPVEPIDPQILNSKGSLFLTRPSLAHYAATREEFRSRAEDVLGMISSSALSIRVGETLPLAHADEAHRRLEGRKTTGKVLLIV